MTDQATTTAVSMDAQSSVQSSRPIKPGYKTTEFWLALAAKLLGAAFAAGFLGDGSELSRLAGLAAVVLSSLGYTVNRAIVKTALVLLFVGATAHLSMACGASTRQDTINTTLKAVDSAKAAWATFDAKHELDLVAAAPDEATAQASVAAWQGKQVTVEKAFGAAYAAIAAAQQAQSDPTVNGMLAAAAIVAQELAALGVTP